MSHALSLRFQATVDLLKRYRAVLAHAWRARKQIDTAPRLPHEAQFLPAALALMETPVSPAPRVTMWLLIAFACIAVVWAIVGKIDVVATAQGKIVADDRTKIIQPMETSAVKAIHVTDGQLVKAGDVLIELDATAATADMARVNNDLLTAKLQAARAQALLAAMDTHRPPRIAIAMEVDTVRLQNEQHLLEGQYAELQTKLDQLNAELTKHQAELQSTEEMVRKLEMTVPIAQQRAQDMKGLVEKNFVAKHQYLELEQTRIEQEADLATQRSRRNEIKATLESVKRQQATVSAEARHVTLDSLHEAEQKIGEFTQQLIKAETRGKLMTLIAPVAGTVQQLAVHTVGGVVTPAQPLMMIVPQDNPIEVEAFIENKDIGFVNPGQDAEVKIETFQFTKYGTIHAQVTHVSRDAINDEKRGLIYSSRVKLERATMQVEDKVVNLTPGMAVSVEIKTGKRRVVEYFLSPLMQHTSESLHER